MSCLKMPKKLKQLLLSSSTNKAWNSLTSSLHPKLRHLGRHLKSVTTTARRHLRPKRHRPRPAFAPRKPRFGGGARLSYNQQYQHLQAYSGPNSPATVYVDQLYQPSSSSSSRVNTRAAEVAEPPARATNDAGRAAAAAPPARATDDPGCAASSGGQDGGDDDELFRIRRRKKKVAEGSSSSSSRLQLNGVKWKEYISSLPPLQGVDERAEEFISAFRHQMELQREQSLIDFHNMLDRTA